MLIDRYNFKKLYPEGVTWSSLIGTCTTYVLPKHFEQRRKVINGVDMSLSIRVFPVEDILRVMMLRKQRGMKLQNGKMWLKKWNYMIKRSEELLNEKR